MVIKREKSKIYLAGGASKELIESSPVSVTSFYYATPTTTQL